MKCLELNPNDVEKIQQLIAELKLTYKTADHDAILQKVRYLACLLPSSIQQFYRDLKMDHDHSGITILKGFPASEVGETPPSWDYSDSYYPSLDIDFFAVLICSCVGHVFGWTTQQKGKIIHDLIPQKNRGEAQTGYGSTSDLLIHTEDAFHDYRADFVCMYGVKNQGMVPTTFASIRDISLSDKVKDMLFESPLDLRPDESHLDEQQTSDSAQEVMQNEASKITTLYGNKAFPYFCFDPAYTDFDRMNEEMLKIYGELEKEVNDKTRDIVISEGQLCIIDNRKVVHGRRRFTPKFDGSDRWLKRINITTNLRKSASVRSCVKSKLIG